MAGPFDANPILLIIDDLEQILATPQPDQLITPVKDAPGSRDVWRTSLVAVLRAFGAAATPSRLLLTSRYRFTLPDGRGRDLADRLLPVQLRPMRTQERFKQWRAAERVEAQAAGHSSSHAPSQIDPVQAVAAQRLSRLALAVASGNPGLQQILCRPILAGELETAATAIAAVAHWKEGGQLPPAENAAQAFFQRIALATYANALTAAQRTQLRAATLFSEGVTVPMAALEAAGRALMVADPHAALQRLIGLGLVDGWGLIDRVEHAAANPLARPLAGATLTAHEQALLAAAALPPLHQAWRDAAGDFPVDHRAVEAARLALLGAVAATLVEAAAYPAGYHLFYTEHDARAALALLQPALAQIEAQGAAVRPRFLRLAADCAERIGETGLQINLLEKGLAMASDDRRAMAQLLAAHAEATLARDGPDRALERLRGAVVVFEELDDVRERAVTMGQIADILEQRGETDEALRIQIEERLPVAEQIQDMDLIAHIRFSCARIRLDRGGLQGDEAQAIVDELAESFTLNQKLQRADGIAFVGFLLGRVLAAVGLGAEALTVLDHAAAAFARLQQDAQVAQIREMQAHLRRTSSE